MKKTALHSFSPSKIFVAFAFAQTISLSSPQAMEADPHDKCMQEALKNFTHRHFIEKQGIVPIYDVTVASSHRIHQLHQENMATFQKSLFLSHLSKSGISLTDDTALSSWSYWDYPWYALESIKSVMPNIGWPSFYGSSPSVPDNSISPTDLQDSSYGFYLLDDTSKPQGTDALIDTDPQDFSTKSEVTTHPDDLLGLALDGGGVRGLMPAMWIALLEKLTNQPVSKIFHLIGGTSIGGIGALVLTASDDGKTPRMSGGNLAELIEKHSDEIFPKPSRYNLIARLWTEFESLRYSRYPTGPLEGLLKKHVGDLTLANSLTRILVTAVNSNTVAPRVFDSATDQVCKMWEAGLCTSAAPTFFPAHLLSTDGQYYIDGGISKNNPGLDVLKGLGEMPTFSLNQTTILSLGTGNMPLGKIPSDAGISSVGTIVDALIATQSRSVEMTLGTLLPKEGYYRTNPTFDRSISLDQLDEDSLRLLKEGAESQYGVIEEFVASELVRKRLEQID